MSRQKVYRRCQTIRINAMGKAGTGNSFNLNTFFIQNCLCLLHQHKGHYRVLCAMHKLDWRIGNIREF